MSSQPNDNQIGRVAFVASGSFNPAILHPDWFSRHSIVPSEEADALLAEPIRQEIPDLGVIEIGKHFIVEPTRTVLNFKSLAFKVEREKFQILCEERNRFPFLIDVVKKIFLVLPETPVMSYGINVIEHIKCENSAENIINEFFKASDKTSNFFGKNTDYGHKIFIKNKNETTIVQIEHSTRITGAIYLHMTFDYKNPSINISNDFIVKEIDENFKNSVQFTEKLIDTFCGKIVDRLQRRRP